MGVSKFINFNNFPKQSNWLGRYVKVLFNYDTDKFYIGRIVRSDSEGPMIDLIKYKPAKNRELYVLSTECQYSVYFNTDELLDDYINSLILQGLSVYRVSDEHICPLSKLKDSYEISDLISPIKSIIEDKDIVIYKGIKELKYLKYPKLEL